MILPLNDQEGMPKNHNQMTIKMLLQTHQWYQDLLYKISEKEKLKIIAFAFNRKFQINYFSCQAAYTQIYANY